MDFIHLLEAAKFPLTHRECIAMQRGTISENYALYRIFMPLNPAIGSAKTIK